ncbi:hypothetical protein ACLEQD_37875, partial [Corallococcus sp. 4LFB]
QAPGMDARVRERWSLPALSLKDESGAKALQAALRPKLQQLLARRAGSGCTSSAAAAPPRKAPAPSPEAGPG